MSTSTVHTESKFRRLIPSVITVLFLSVLPVSAYGEDDQSIAALRQMGKAFADDRGQGLAGRGGHQG